MLHKIKTAALGGLLVLTAGVTLAQAETLKFRLGDQQNDPEIGIQIGPNDRDDQRYGDRRYEERRDERIGDRDNRSGRRCTPERALQKAQDMGIRRARIQEVGRRTIDIVGRSQGERVRVTFSRAPRCPVIG